MHSRTSVPVPLQVQLLDSHHWFTFGAVTVHALQLTHRESWIVDRTLHNVDCRLSIAHCTTWIDCRSHIAQCRLWIVDCGLWIVDCRLQIKLALPGHRTSRILYLKLWKITCAVDHEIEDQESTSLSAVDYVLVSI